MCSSLLRGFSSSFLFSHKNNFDEQDHCTLNFTPDFFYGLGLAKSNSVVLNSRLDCWISEKREITVDQRCTSTCNKYDYFDLYNDGKSVNFYEK